MCVWQNRGVMLEMEEFVHARRTEVLSSSHSLCFQCLGPHPSLCLI